MKRTASIIFLLSLSLLMWGQENTEKEKKQKKDKTKKEKVEKVDLSEKEQTRPVNPWVFVAGVDETPGRIVVALNKDLWLTYDTATCSAFRIWRGSAFVNTNSENRDMVIDGFHFLKTPGTDRVWTIKKGNTTLNSTVSFWSEEIEEDRLVLSYMVKLDDGQSFMIKESPEYQLEKKPDENRTTLERRFTLINPPAGISVLLDVEAADLVKMGDIKASTKILNLKKSKRMYDWGDLLSVSGSLLLHNSKETTLLTTYTMNGESYFSSRPSAN